jgi:hypothetical protein
MNASQLNFVPASEFKQRAAVAVPMRTCARASAARWIS